MMKIFLRFTSSEPPKPVETIFIENSIPRRIETLSIFSTPEWISATCACGNPATVMVKINDDIPMPKCQKCADRLWEEAVRQTRLKRETRLVHSRRGKFEWSPDGERWYSVRKDKIKLTKSIGQVTEKEYEQFFERLYNGETISCMAEYNKDEKMLIIHWESTL